MKLNSTQIRSAAVIALLAGLSPALLAQTAGQYGVDRNQPAPDAIPGDTDRDARAEDRSNAQRPGHNSNRTSGQQASTSSTTVVPGDTDRDSRAEDRPDTQRPGHNSNRPAGQQASTTSSTTVLPGHTVVPDQTGPDRRDMERPSADPHYKGAHGSAASGIVYSQDHVGEKDRVGADMHAHPRADGKAHVAGLTGTQLRKGSANELTGMAVKNRSGENLGKIKDFVIDTGSGQVVYAVVASGGIAGFGEKLHAVPVQALNHNVAGDRESLTLDVETSRWDQAPRFSRDELANLQQDQQGRSIHEYYGQTWRSAGRSTAMNNPVRSQGSQPVATTSTRNEIDRQLPDRQLQGHRLALASDLIGKNIRNGGQTIGEIEDVIVQFDSGSAAALLDPDNDFAGSDQKYVVPLSRFTLAENSALTATLQRSDFSSARAVQGDAWASGQGQSDSLYVWQGDRRTDSAFTKSEKGVPPVAEIRRAIQSDSSIAANQNDIQVEARGDKLVLRGTVLNEDTKEKIEDRAEKAAPGWDIDNQLSVAATSDME